MHILSILGPPGAGKSTLARTICSITGFVHLSSGDLMRKVALEDSGLGQTIRQYIEAGIPIPDDLANTMVSSTFAICGGPYDQLLLDGYPRTLTQARHLDTTLARAHRAVSQVYFLFVSPQCAIERLSRRWTCPACASSYVINPENSTLTCSRCAIPLTRRWGDGDAAIIEQRRGVFYNDTGPVLEHYGLLGVLRQLNGELSQEQLIRIVLNHA